MSEVSKAKVETKVETVKMLDGRNVEFVGKRRLLKESNISESGAINIRLDFRNGETREFTVPPELVARFAAHGAEQKLGDEVAGYDENELDDAVLAVDDLIDRLYNGEWTIRREGGGFSGLSMLAKALVEHTKQPAEQVKTFLKARNKAEKDALARLPAVATIVARLKAEKDSKTSKLSVEEAEGVLAGLTAAA